MTVSINIANAFQGYQNNLEQAVKKHLKYGLQQTLNFIWETPVSIVTAAVTGVALLIFYSAFAPPFLGLAAASTLTRLVVIVIDIHDIEYLIDIKEKILDFSQGHSKVEYIAMLVAVTVCILSSTGGVLISIGVGIYKGMIVEIDIFKYKLELQREKLNNPTPSSRMAIINC